MDIDFGAGLEAAGCRWSEIPARPCEEANVGRSKAKTATGMRRERVGWGNGGHGNRFTAEMLEVGSDRLVDGDPRWARRRDGS